MTFHRVTAAEADAAYEAWGCNCGPAAIAAILGVPLDEVRPHLIGFDAKRYTNPTMMAGALDTLGRPWRNVGKAWPRYGLARIQWEGPWTKPGVPMRVRYRHTHWVGSWQTVERGHGVFDVNALGNGSGWARFEHWRDVMVPYITSHIPRADGLWHVTHGIEIEIEPGRVSTSATRPAAGSAPEKPAGATNRAPAE
ncbi:MAG: hypothetical protein AB7L90_17660 [Hyphomicrobiaceae bacterium]